MATRQTRWVCGTCQREWVYAHNWQPDDGCPGCRSSAIRSVEYLATFPGGDVPRGAAVNADAPPPPRIVDATPAPLVLGSEAR